MKYTIILIFALSLISCKSKKDLVEEVKTVTPAGNGQIVDFTIRLKEGGCFGVCPVFNMVVSKTGLATYEGGAYSDRIGTFEKQLSLEKMQELQAAYQNANFYTLSDNFKSNIPDLQLFTISVDQGRRPTKTVKFKENKPKALADLHQVLHDIAYDKEGWILVKAADLDADIPQAEKAKPLVDKSQLIIELEGSTKVATWFKANKDLYGLSLIKKVTPNANYWLYEYDTAKYSEEEIINLISADGQVKSVEFNHTVENR